MASEQQKTTYTAAEVIRYNKLRKLKKAKK